jgi:hypothetical protein
LHEKKLIKPRVIADIQFRKQAIAPRMGGYLVACPKEVL